MTASARLARHAPTLWLAALMLAYVALYATSMPTADTIRDVSRAWLLHAHGEWPAQGPDIYSRYALGPIWFWLLGGLLVIAPSFTALAIGVGVLASLKFPLAFRLAERVLGPGAGYVATAWLAMHGVALIEHWTFAHTNLVLATSFLVLTCAARLHDAPDDRRWLMFALALVLAVHAHPTNLLTVLAVLPVLWRHRARAISPAAFAVAALVVVLAMLPTALFVANGSLWYAQDAGRITLTPASGWLPRAGVLWLHLAFDPLRILAESLGDTNARAIAIGATIFSAVGLLSALALDRSRRTFGLFAATAAGCLAMVAVRQNTPLWMALALLPPFALLIAAGWRSLWLQRPRTRAIGLIAIVALTAWMQATWFASRSEALAQGEQGLPNRRVRNLTLEGTDAQRRQPLFALLAMDRFARRFCADWPRAAIFGDLALGVATAEAMPFLIQGCAPARWPSVGGTSAHAVAGLVAATGATSAAGWPRVPGYALLPVRQVLHPRDGLRLRELPPYPPITLFDREPLRLQFAVTLAADEMLAWSTRYRFEPESTLALGGSAMIESDDVSLTTRVYRCKGACTLQLTLTTPYPELLQLYTITRAELRRMDRAE